MVLFLTTFGSGVLFSQRLNKRLFELKLIERLAQRIQVRLEFRSLSTEEILDQLVCDSTFQSFSFLPHCQHLMQKDELSFPKAWKAAVEKKKNSLSLNEEELQVLVSLSEIIGSASVQRQLSSLEGVQKELHRMIDDAQNDCKKKGKLYRSLGILGGAAVAIITI